MAAWRLLSPHHKKDLDLIPSTDQVPLLGCVHFACSSCICMFFFLWLPPTAQRLNELHMSVNGCLLWSCVQSVPALFPSDNWDRFHHLCDL